MPFVKEENIFIIAIGLNKTNYIEEILKQRGYGSCLYHMKKQIVLIDDSHKILFDHEDRGYLAIHPSELVD
jgi:hypothetical protein